MVLFLSPSFILLWLAAKKARGGLYHSLAPQFICQYKYCKYETQKGCYTKWCLSLYAGDGWLPVL